MGIDEAGRGPVLGEYIQTARQQKKVVEEFFAPFLTALSALAYQTRNCMAHFHVRGNEDVAFSKNTQEALRCTLHIPAPTLLSLEDRYY